MKNSQVYFIHQSHIQIFDNNSLKEVKISLSEI